MCYIADEFRNDYFNYLIWQAMRRGMLHGEFYTVSRGNGVIEFIEPERLEPGGIVPMTPPEARESYADFVCKTTANMAKSLAIPKERLLAPIPDRSNMTDKVYEPLLRQRSESLKRDSKMVESIINSLEMYNKMVDIELNAAVIAAMLPMFLPWYKRLLARMRALGKKIFISVPKNIYIQGKGRIKRGFIYLKVRGSRVLLGL